MNETLYALIHLVGTYDEALRDRLLREVERKGDPPPPAREDVVIYFRFFHKFASGRERWEYMEAIFSRMPTTEQWNEYLEDYARERMAEYNWSDKYRGIEFERLEGHPPVSWVKEEVSHLESGMRYDIRRLDRLRRLLKEYPEEETA